MPITVIVRSTNTGAPSLTFDGTRIVIGRSDGSDVRLPDPSVSLRHASLRPQGNQYAIVDEGSTNGTWVGGVKLSRGTPRLVKTGDLVRVGRVWLEISIGDRVPTPDLGLATRELALALVRNAMDSVGDDTLAKVCVAEGPDMGAELPLVEEGREYVIGRAESSGLPLADEDASREHAVVVRRRGQIVLRDLSSRNGVFLGEARIAADREVAWRPPTMVRIGRSVLALHDPVTHALAQLESVEDEPLPDADAPPPPVDEPPASPQKEDAPAPRSGRAVEAPIADVGASRSPSISAVRSRRRVWTFADVALVTIAVVVIAASLAGLVWVLR